MHENLSFPPAARRTQRREAEVQPELLTARQAARLLGLSIRALHYKRDALPSPIVLSHKCVRWRRADLLKFVAGLPAGNEQRREPAQLVAARQKRRAGGDFPCDGAVTGDHRAQKPASGVGVGRPEQNRQAPLPQK